MSESFPFEGGESAKKPPILNNMGGLNPERTKNSSKWAGIDQLTLNYFIQWENWETENKNKSGESLRPKLDAAHIKAIAKSENVDLEDFDAVLHPGGGKIAKKYCRFKIELKSAIILIDDRPKYSTWPNVKIEICGERCLTYPGGAIAAYRDAVNFLIDTLGANVHKESVSRVDLAADFPGWAMFRFYHPYARRNYACRSRGHHPYHNPAGMSLYFGMGDVILRVYDKLKEMENAALRGSPAKFEHMVQKRWGGKRPECATRVEYQLRRAFLKKFGVSDMDSFCELQGDLLAYLTGANPDKRWFRFLTNRPHPKKPELNVCLPRWKSVQKQFLDNFGLIEPLRIINPDNSDVEILVKQAFGVLEAAACNKGYDIEGKKSAAEKKYSFEHYEDFERWALAMLRTAALEKPQWKFKDKDRIRTSIDDELEWLEEQKEKIKNGINE